ncbi:hypothetical protein V1264_008865 [Littorina saxatilis]|uniref:Uncharacterized protein n=2 Tax=Littorina saxatilis TaxID=31220 RepID=A0AAN9AQG1_9CAEN
MHKSRPDGTPWLKPNRSFHLQVFFPSLYHTEPERVEWSIQCRKDPVQLQRSECYIYVDVGYVRQDRPWSDFLETQDTSTIRASLKMKEYRCTHFSVPVSSQAPVPMETGTFQDEMTNHELSNSRSCVSNLLHNPNSLPAIYHPAQTLRPQEQPTLLERGYGQNPTVVNIAKVVANKLDLASLLHPQQNGMESYFEQGMITATRTSQNEQSSGRVAADQKGEETARKSLTSSEWQGASPKKKKKKNRKSHCTPSEQCPTQPMRLPCGNERNETNGEDINQVTQAPMETVGNAPQELSTSSTRSQMSENPSFELKCPVPCSADVSGTHTNRDNVSGSRNAMLEALGGSDLVEDDRLSCNPS